jgi:hypothetical protein
MPKVPERQKTNNPYLFILNFMKMIDEKFTFEMVSKYNINGMFVDSDQNKIVIYVPNKDDYQKILNFYDKDISNNFISVNLFEKV